MWSFRKIENKYDRNSIFDVTHTLFIDVLCVPKSFIVYNIFSGFVSLLKDIII